MAKRKKKVPPRSIYGIYSGDFMRLRLGEFHRFVREMAELFGDAFTLTMLGNAVADLGYPSDAVHRLAKRARD